MEHFNKINTKTNKLLNNINSLKEIYLNSKDELNKKDNEIAQYVLQIQTLNSMIYNLQNEIKLKDSQISAFERSKANKTKSPKYKEPKINKPKSPTFDNNNKYPNYVVNIEEDPPKVSKNIQQESQHIRQESQHIRQESQHIRQESQHIRQESQHIQQESQHIRQESQHIQQESQHIRQEYEEPKQQTLILDDNYEILELDNIKYIINLETQELFEFADPLYTLNLLGILKNFKIKSGKQYITNTYTNKVYNFENNEIMDYCGDIINGKLKLIS
jgi:chromosome segregation ATPase